MRRDKLSYLILIAMMLFATRSEVLTAKPNILLYGKRPADELYHVEDDPECIRNLASNPEYLRVLKKAKSKLHEVLCEQDDPRMHGKGEAFDNYPATIPWREIYTERKAWEKKNSRN